MRWIFRGATYASAFAGLIVLFSCSAGTTAVPVSPSSSVMVSPSTVGIAAGSLVQLNAVVLGADGIQVPCASLRWTSSDSTLIRVTQAGGVVGLQQGQVTVRASCGSASGAADVVSTVATPPDYTRITERAFSSKAASRDDSVGAEGWESGDEYNAPLFSIVSDPTAPRSAPLVGQMQYPVGFPGGSQPAIIDKVIVGNFRSISISLWVKLSSNWYGHSSHVNKVVFMWMAGFPKFILSADGAAYGPLYPTIRIQNSLDQTDARLPNVVPAAEVVRGQWQHWELLVDSNDPGSANGRVRWWINGLLVSDWSDIQLADPGTTPRWEIFEWGPTWGGVGDVLPAEQFMWWDHVIVSGK
jgi:hypothetical protein